MDKANLRLSGKLEANGNGTIANQSFKLTATAGFANGGAVTLTANPGFSPAYTDKAANFTGDNVKAIADIGELQNIDLKFAKGGVDLAGQTCDVTVARDSSGASGVEIKSNVDKVGDVTVSLVQEGHKTLNNEDEAAAAAAVRISADIPLSDVNADLTGSVDYDLVGKDANIRIGYHKDDITVRLRTNVDSDKKAKTTINLDYSGIEAETEIMSAIVEAPPLRIVDSSAQLDSSAATLRCSCCLSGVEGGRVVDRGELPG